MNLNSNPLAPTLDYLPEMPQNRRIPIGCIGSGFIMSSCHLLSYQQSGFNPVAIFGRNQESVTTVAKKYDIPNLFFRLEDFLDHPGLEILDISVPPDVQPEIIFKICARKKEKAYKSSIRGILAQKPLAMSLSLARKVVSACEDADITLAVNQNMRYDQSVRASKQLIQSDYLGELILATIDMRAIPHWMPWSEKLHSLSTFVMSIHHLDTFRYWFGTPERVFASTAPDPRTKFPHRDGINLYILEYNHGLRASSWDDVWTGPAREGGAASIGIQYRIEGTKGTALGTIGWPDYPKPTPSTLRWNSTEISDQWICPKWKEVWFPDAFAGTMAQLMVALEKGTTPEISGRDNLETIALCEAIYQSAQDHRVVSLAEYLN